MGTKMIDERRTWELLARGGTERREGIATKYSGLADPAGAEELAIQLAELARDLAPTAILVWEDAEDVLLGHVVGRELSLPVVRAYDQEGLVAHSAGFPDRPRTVLVADAIRQGTSVRAARALTEQRGGTFAGTVVIVNTPELRAAAADAGTVLSLVQIADPTGDSGSSSRRDGA